MAIVSYTVPEPLKCIDPKLHRTGNPVREEPSDLVTV